MADQETHALATEAGVQLISTLYTDGAGESASHNSEEYLADVNDTRHSFPSRQPYN